MRIILSAQNSASSVIRSVAGDIGSMARFVPGAIAAGLALAGIGVAMGIAIKQAADFQQGLNRLITGAGDTTDNMQKMGQAILGVSADTGVMTGPLLQAMYLIISSGQRGAQALDTLSVAAKGAQIEQANVVDVANTLSGVMTNYGTRTHTATQYMNGLIEAVKHGKITLQDLATSMGPIDPIAQQLGISMNDIAAAMTTQTNAMIPAARAATGLRFMMQALENPTKKARTEMAALGLDSIKVAEEMKVSLPGALEMIDKAALKVGPEGSVPFNRAVGNMVGGLRGLSAFMGLTGSHMKDFVANSKAIAAAMNASSKQVSGWDVAQSGFNIQMDRAHAALNVLLITIGSQLLPVLTTIVKAVTPIITAFAKWISNADNAKTALAILGGVIAGLAAIVLAVAVPALIALITTMWPILLVGLAVGAAVFGIIMAFQHWGAITQWLSNVVGTVGAFIGGIFSWLGTHVHGILSDIGSFVGGVFSAIGTTIRNILTGIKDFVGGVFSAIGTFIRDRLTWIKNTAVSIWDAIKNAFSAALTFIKNLVGTIFSAIGSWFTWLYNHNYYIKALCDEIVRRFAILKDRVGALFSAIGTFIHNALIWIRNTVGAIFSAIGTFIHDSLDTRRCRRSHVCHRHNHP